MVRTIITRLRQKVSKYIEVLGVKLYKLGLTPNIITLLGLTISMVCPIAAFFKRLDFVLTLMTVSSFIDILDGALARVSGKITKFGSVLDSFSDRVSEFMFLYSLALLGVPTVLTLPVLAISFLISYLRALGEKYGLKIEGVGILERGERLTLVFIALIGIWINYTVLTYFSLTLLLFLGCITVLQRLGYMQKLLR